MNSVTIILSLLSPARSLHIGELIVRLGQHTSSSYLWKPRGLTEKVINHPSFGSVQQAMMHRCASALPSLLVKGRASHARKKNTWKHI